MDSVIWTTFSFLASIYIKFKRFLTISSYGYLSTRTCAVSRTYFSSARNGLVSQSPFDEPYFVLIVPCQSIFLCFFVFVLDKLFIAAHCWLNTHVTSGGVSTFSESMSFQCVFSLVGLKFRFCIALHLGK